MRLVSLSIAKINPAPYNPRKDLKPDDAEYQRLVSWSNDFCAAKSRA
ncbi:MAG: hypothetical protein O7D91_04270 [Planctomycetota bacterium]|nr:hypothetical protein [Planctomycetota bacterium]